MSAKLCIKEKIFKIKCLFKSVCHIYDLFYTFSFYMIHDYITDNYHIKDSEDNVTQKTHFQESM